MIHANGWDKTPLLRLLQRSGHLSEQEATSFYEQKAALEKQKVGISLEGSTMAAYKEWGRNCKSGRAQ